MKSLIAVVSILFTIAANAGVDANSSWKELRKAKMLNKVTFELPQYQLTHGHFVDADNACLDGNVLKSKTKKSIKKCMEWDNDGNCTRTITVFPAIAVSGTRYGCVEYGNNDSGEWACLEYGQVSYSYETSFDINVFKYNGDGQIGDFHSRMDRGRKLFTKSLEVEACK